MDTTYWEFIPLYKGSKKQRKIKTVSTIAGDPFIVADVQALIHAYAMKMDIRTRVWCRLVCKAWRARDPCKPILWEFKAGFELTMRKLAALEVEVPVPDDIDERGVLSWGESTLQRSGKWSTGGFVAVGGNFRLVNPSRLDRIACILPWWPGKVLSFSGRDGSDDSEDDAFVAAINRVVLAHVIKIIAWPGHFKLLHSRIMSRIGRRHPNILIIEPSNLFPNDATDLELMLGVEGDVLLWDRKTKKFI